MRLSDGEKLILIMLSEIYEHLDIKGEIDPKFMREAIFSDHLWGLPWNYSGIKFEDENGDPPYVKTVVDILDMWFFIERAAKKLPEQELAKLKENTGYSFFDFEGFDGNNEGEYYSTALFIVNKLNRFTHFKNRELNSHSPSIDMYERMLDVFLPMRGTFVGRDLNLDELTALFRAKAYPQE